jgi:hypothetical protein
MKHFFLLFIFTLVFISCSNDDDTNSNQITYKLFLEAKAAPQGINNFTQIKYKDASGVEMVINNRETTFEISFEIEKDFNIFFTVDGVNNASAFPGTNVSYKVVKFIDNVDNGIVCLSNQITEFGSVGNWTFSASFNVVFDGSTCN